MLDHGLLTAGEIHTIFEWTFADLAARSSATNPNTLLGYVTNDLKKACYQTDTDKAYILKDTTPTWILLGGGAAGVQITESFTGISGTADIVLAQTPTSITGPFVVFNSNFQIYGSAYTIDLATKTVTFARNLVADDIIGITYTY